MLYFATSQATLSALETLMSEVPTVHDSLDLSEKAADTILEFTSKSEATLIACGRYQDFRNIMQNSEAVADRRLDDLPTPEYPTNIAPAIYRKRIILHEQFKNLVDYQKRELQALKKTISGSRSEFLESIGRDNPSS